MKKVGVIASKYAAKSRNYYAAVEAAGAEVIVLDPYSGDSDIDLLCNEIDGLLIPGGVDIQPSFYHEENIACGELDPVLDDFEMDALTKTLNAQKPVLGVCRGLQLLNVFFGGTLYQDIFCANCHKRDHEADRVHLTKVVPDTFIYEVYKKPEIYVNSAHHQAVKDLGKDLVPAQFSQEGILEAFYHKNKPIYAVQWHPERMCLENVRTDTENGLELFKFFVGIL